MKPEFEPGIAVVVGGSGGMGRAIAEGFAARGSDVALTYFRNREAADEAAAAIDALGATAHVRQLDSGDLDAVSAFFDELVTLFGTMHTIVNATGADIPMRFIHDVGPDEWRRVIDSDVHGFFHVVHASLPHLRAQGGGSYVALSSAGHRRWPSRDVLSVAPKAAVEALIQGVAREEGRFGIRANSVQLGVIDAGIFHRLQGEGFDDTWVEAARNNTALKRFGTAEEVADAVLFFASKRASYVTGQYLVLDGGYSI